MKISASVKSSRNCHVIDLNSNNISQTIDISPKKNGFGSSVNGGELLWLALATCFCNDIYREASKSGMTINGLEVHCTADFGKEGEVGKSFAYHAIIDSPESKEAIRALISYTESIAEIQNTLRQGAVVNLQFI